MINSSVYVEISLFELEGDILAPSAQNAATARQGTQIKSVLRAASLLELLADNSAGLTIKELSAASGLNASTCHHHLSTLVAVGMVRAGSQHRYLLGPKIGELHRKYTLGTSVVQRIRHLLEDVSVRTLETSYLTAWRAGQPALIDVVETIKPALQPLRPGYTGPAYSRASGKALLAGLSEEELVSYLRETTLVPLTPNTITNEHDLRAELAKIRAQGYALDREEHQIGAYCVAAPVLSRTGKTAGAIAISMSKERVADLEELAETVRNAARMASSDIGDFI